MRGKTTNRMRGCRLIFFAGWFGVTITGFAQNRVVFEDTFKDRARWFTGNAASTLTVSRNTLTQVLADDTVLTVCYLTDQIGKRVSLEPGQTLRMSYRISFSHVGQGAYFRYGVFGSADDARLTGDGVAGGFSSSTDSDTFKGALGYAVWADRQVKGAGVEIMRRKGEALQAGLLSSRRRFSSCAGSGTFSDSLMAGTQYDGTFEIKNEENGSRSLHASLWYMKGPEKVLVYDFSAQDAGGVSCPDFDMLAFSAAPGFADSFSLHFIKVEILSSSTSEPLMLKTASVFSENMVLQQMRSVPVWGHAAPHSEVSVEFAGQTRTTNADDAGSWAVSLEPMAASASPLTLTVTSAGEQIVFQNVLVGEVWLCSGQSNMEWRMKNADHAAAGIAEATNTLIRLFHVPRRISLTPENVVSADWKVCSPEEIPEFSAVAYYFGQKIQTDIDVPVGLILSAWGGTPIEGWMPELAFEAEGWLHEFYQNTEFPELLDPGNKEHRQYPALLYNGMIHALVPFAMRGVIWYQGEANVKDSEPSQYTGKTRALLDFGWRRLWGYEFPFYFVQLAPYRYWKTIPADALPRMWDAQSQILNSVSNTGMAVVSDTVENLRDVHPRDKKTPGIRLALLALEHVYGRNVISSGPLFRSVRKIGNSLSVEFDFSAGLSTRDGLPPSWFEVAGENGRYQPVKASIENDKIVLDCSEILDPRSIRFSWAQTAINNLVNSAGLPAAAFRSEISP